MKKILIIALTLMMFSTAAFAAKPSTPEKMATAGLDLLIEGKYGQMTDVVLESASPKFMTEEQLKAAKSQIVAQLPLNEKYLRYELVEKKEFGKSLVKLIYLVVSEEVPLVFSFEYYKPRDKWQILNFHFKDNTSELQ